MSLLLRILGCLILGLLVLGLGYERVLNADAEKKVTAIELENSESEKKAGGDEPSLEEVEALTFDDTGDIDSVDIDNKSGLDEPLVDVFDDNILVEEPDLRAAPGSAEIELINDDAIDEQAEVQDRSEVESLPATSLETTDGEALETESSPSNIPPAPSGPSLADREQTGDAGLRSASALTGEVRLQSRIVLDETVSVDGADLPLLEIFDRKLLHSSGALKFPYKKMPSEWMLSAVEPIYPAACEGQAQQKEIVVVQFRVDRRGRAYRPKTASATNDCFSRETLRAVRRMKFRVRAAPGYYYGGSIFLMTFEFAKQGGVSQ